MTACFVPYWMMSVCPLLIESCRFYTRCSWVSAHNTASKNRYQQRPPSVLLVATYSGCVLSTEHTSVTKNGMLNISILHKYEKKCSKLCCFKDQTSLKWDQFCASCWISNLLPHMLIFSLWLIRAILLQVLLLLTASRWQRCRTHCYDVQKAIGHSLFTFLTSWYKGCSSKEWKQLCLPSVSAGVSAVCLWGRLFLFLKMLPHIVGHTAHPLCAVLSGCLFAVIPPFINMQSKWVVLHLQFDLSQQYKPVTNWSAFEPDTSKWCSKIGNG